MNSCQLGRAARFEASGGGGERKDDRAYVSGKARENGEHFASCFDTIYLALRCEDSPHGLTGQLGFRLSYTMAFRPASA